MQLPAHRTKIVCTIGPASDAPPLLEQMMEAGMNVARINLAHGTQEEHEARITRIRRAAEKTGHRVAILADLPGPKLRIGTLPAPVILQPHAFVLLAPDAPGTAEQIPFDLPPLARPLAPGSAIFLNDGFIELRVDHQDNHGILCHVVVGGTLLSHKGVNVPGMALQGGAFTAADRKLMAFALRAGADGLGVSFVEIGDDLHVARTEARALGFTPFLIAKIERARALSHIGEIIEACDGIMIARGDLGVEVPIAETALIQKRLIHNARAAGKAVITATQMLESMVHNPRPTRAEVTDVANAILDGTDCVMLSEESAIGDFPLEAINTLAEIARVTEESRHELQPMTDNLDNSAREEFLIARNVRDNAERLHPRFVITPTQTGATAARIARFRLQTWIVALSPDGQTCQRLCLHYGVYPVSMAKPDDSWGSAARRWLIENGYASGQYILTQGPSKGHLRATNRLEILRLETPDY